MGGILSVHEIPELLCEIENVARDSTDKVASSE